MTDRVLRVMDLGRRAYAPVAKLQEELVERRCKGLAPDTLVLVEHEPVYTLGRNANTEHLLASDEELARLGIDVAQTGRGGDITYHGPGQLVGYPILDLGSRGCGAVWYVDHIELTLVKVLETYGVQATRDKANRGVWVGRDKIAAIGVRITRRITMHGFALNVRPDLSHFGGIVPCGIRGRGVTSLHLFVPDVEMPDVKRRVVSAFAEVFEYACIET